MCPGIGNEKPVELKESCKNVVAATFAVGKQLFWCQEQLASLLNRGMFVSARIVKMIGKRNGMSLSKGEEIRASAAQSFKCGNNKMVQLTSGTVNVLQHSEAILENTELANVFGNERKRSKL